MKQLLVAAFAASLQTLVSGLWPVPAEMTKGNAIISIDVDHLAIVPTSHSCSILDKAISRYLYMIKKEDFVPPLDYNAPNFVVSAKMTGLNITIASQDETLTMDTDESYCLTIAEGTGVLNANTVYGALRGLETFSQLIVYNYGKHIIKDTPITISDAPVFKHRGLSLDTARNYYPLDSLKRTIDGLSYTKMNVLHWHIVDSHSWPVESKFNPDLFVKGAYGPTMIYTHEQVSEIIQYAKERGVRVIPEFDMPGHTYIVGQSMPEIMSCLNDQPRWDITAAQPPSGQLNIVKPGAYDFTANVVREYSGLFTDNVFHVGGDEVNRKCWLNDISVQTHLNSTNTTIETVLENYYDFLYKNLQYRNKVGMCWEETLMHTNFTVPKDTIIQAWIDQTSVVDIVKKGYRVVASPYMDTYLDCGHGPILTNMPKGNSWCNPFKSWMRIYDYDPLTNITDAASAELVLGGEVALWSEQSDPVVLDRYLWPRAAAYGETLWSGRNDTATGKPRGFDNSAPRIQEHRERLLLRGIAAEPLVPLWCVRNPGMCELPAELF
ncbi:Beta-hexosaminidase 2 [Zancudomyces culisetae]|uniref:Beta-hexosaminidase n=1 Tax=Zancudomyces culisetae TaxID=1213189 RepID=A0A1R1PT84_ZANCU|nr:Beta-hexosaminidase 2 [Zancudomyces culisetae]OMH84206.1 Beta-hexosaminidase 2 [Zancudomyces culisetae]|eukprot:OMH81702.1 Beta-hexosaminidase 2 [Zancudomyces culisetae]